MSARQVGFWEVCRYTIRRNRLAVGIATVGALALAGLVVASVVINRNARLRAEAQGILAETARRESDAARAEIETQRTKLAEALTAQRRSFGEAERERYVSSLALAAQEITNGDHRGSLTSLALCPENMRDWVWRRLDLLNALALVRHHDHVDGVTAMVVRGTRVITSGHDGTICWYGDGLRLDGRLQAHRSAVEDLDASGDGELVVSAGQDSSVRLWHPGDAEARKILFGHDGPVLHVRFIDARHLASLGADHTVRVWDWQAGKEIAKRETPGVASFAMGRAGLVLMVDEAAVALLGSDGITEATTADAPSVGVLAVSPGGTLTGTTHDGHPGDVVLRWQPVSGDVHEVGMITGPVQMAAVAPGGTLAAVVTGDSTVWSVALDGSRVPFQLTGHDGAITGLGFTSDGTAMLTAGEDGTLRSWDPHARRDQTSVDAGGILAGLALDQAGARLVSATTTGQVVVWDVRSRQPLRRWTANFPLTAVAISRDGLLVVAGGPQGRCRVWQADTGVVLGSPVHPPKDIHCVAFIDSERYCTTAQDGRIRVWNILDQHEAYSCHGHAGPVFAVLPDAERKVLISGGKDGAIYRFAMRNGENLGQLASGNDPMVDLQLDTTAATVAFARGGQIGWTSADRPGEPRLIQAHARGTTGIALSENAQQLFSIGADGNLRCWDVASGRSLLTVHDFPAIPRKILVVPGGRDVVVGCESGAVVFLHSSAPTH